MAPIPTCCGSKLWAFGIDLGELTKPVTLVSTRCGFYRPSIRDVYRFSRWYIHPKVSLPGCTAASRWPSYGLSPRYVYEVGDVEHIQWPKVLGLTISGIRGFTEGRPFYRPPGNPVLVGSDTFGRVQSGIPTQRRGPRDHLPAVEGVEST